MLDLLFSLLSKVITIYFLILLGLLWRFSPFFKEQYGKIITMITMWIFFPINILIAILSITDLNPVIFLIYAILVLLVNLVSYFSIILVIRYQYRNAHENNNVKAEGAQILAATFPNFVLYPFPIILAVIGPLGIVYAAIASFYMILYRNILGVWIGVKYSTQANTDDSKQFLNKRKMILEMLRFPPFIASIIGFIILVCFGPQSLSSPEVTLIDNISTWGALILIGISFTNISQLRIRQLFSRKSCNIALVRFIICPVILLPLMIIGQLPNMLIFIAVIQFASPPAVSNIIYGKFFGLKSEELARYITSLTFMALLLLPIELLLLEVLFPF